MDDPNLDAIEYEVRLRLPDGREKLRELRSPRRYRLGDWLNLPDDDLGVGKEGQGFMWQIDAVDDDTPSLTVTFVRRHS